MFKFWSKLVVISAIFLATVTLVHFLTSLLYFQIYIFISTWGVCLIALSLIEQESVQILKQLGGYWGNVSPCLVHYNSMFCPCISLLSRWYIPWGSCMCDSIGYNLRRFELSLLLESWALNLYQVLVTSNSKILIWAYFHDITKETSKLSEVVSSKEGPPG
jgi:hypothetical protein